MEIKLNEEQSAAYERGEAVTITKTNKVWEPKHDTFLMWGSGVIPSFQNVSKSLIAMGLARETLEQAKHDFTAMRKHNRMLAYRAEVAPMWEESPDADGRFYSIYFINGDYDVNTTVAPDMGTVCFPKREAEILAAKLNAGEVVF